MYFTERLISVATVSSSNIDNTASPYKPVASYTCLIGC